MSNTQHLQGKAALVFGGSRGIGAAIARRLGSEGVRVALTYATSPDKAQEVADDIEATGTQAIAIQADSSDADAIRNAVERAFGRFGRLDIVVVNAGVLTLGPIDAIALVDLDRALAVNVRGVFLAIQAAQARMGQGGRIITIGSNTANHASPGSSVYAMTKAAVAMLVRSVALDLAPRGITVNNIQPGPTLTDMTQDLIDRVLPHVPVGRVAAPSEIAGMVAYLAGEEAGYITGASLTIDGGMSL